MLSQTLFGGGGKALSLPRKSAAGPRGNMGPGQEEEIRQRRSHYFYIREGLLYLRKKKSRARRRIGNNASTGINTNQQVRLRGRGRAVNGFKGGRGKKEGSHGRRRGWERKPSKNLNAEEEVRRGGKEKESAEQGKDKNSIPWALKGGSINVARIVS